MKKKLTILFSILFSNFVVSQCDIPNANFDEFHTVTNGAFTYDMPDDWSESNAFPFLRNVFGVGFFNKYEGNDASNTVALKLRRSHLEMGIIGSFQKGYMHIECNEIPNKLKGKYKFIGTSSVGAIDTLRIAVKFSTSDNPVDSYELNVSKIIPDAKVIDIIADSPDFSDFEIDFSNLIDQPVEFISIHLMLISGNANFSVDTAEAVIDNLELEYNVLGIPDFNYNKDLKVLPNPSNDFIQILGLSKINNTYLIYDVHGTKVSSGNVSKDEQIDIRNLSNGMYFLKLNNERILKLIKK